MSYSVVNSGLHNISYHARKLPRFIGVGRADKGGIATILCLHCHATDLINVTVSIAMGYGM